MMGSGSASPSVVKLNLLGERIVARLSVHSRYLPGTPSDTYGSEGFRGQVVN